MVNKTGNCKPKNFKLLRKSLNIPVVLILLGTILSSCEPVKDDNKTAELVELELELGGSVFSTIINGSLVTLTRDLPSGTMQVKVSKVVMLPNCTSSLKPGDMINVASGTTAITISNTKSKQESDYVLTLSVKQYSSVVEENGLLKTSGNRIVNKNGIPVSFAGNSFFWSNTGWGGERFFNESAVAWLKLDWETTIVRAVLGVDENGGYLLDKDANKERVKKVIDAAISNGMYVIIDFHSHHAEDHLPEAIEFFTEMATLYGTYDNIIYEIYNEPLKISWPNVLKPYAEAVIQAIRAVDPDNMIIVGTPEWSQQVDKPAADPITISDNIAYTLHFYTVYHKQWLRDRATAALNSGIALFVTEWGSLGYTQNDPEATLWMDWCRENKISHCNWAVNDKSEEWSIINPGASSTGGWQELTEAGYLARRFVRGWNY
jgi:hypothetical protein